MTPPIIASHLLGFVRGAVSFGGSPEAIRHALLREFPRLTPPEVDEVMRGAGRWLPPRVLA